MRNLLLLFPVALAACGGIDLPATQAGALTITRVISPEPIIPGGEPDSASMSVYLTISNGGDLPDTLREVSSAMARIATLHGSMSGQGMVAMTALVIPAHDSVRMMPGGTHLMLQGLSRVISHGDNFPFNLQFARTGVVAVQSSVVSYQDFDRLRPDSRTP